MSASSYRDRERALSLLTEVCSDVESAALTCGLRPAPFEIGKVTGYGCLWTIRAEPKSEAELYLEQNAKAAELYEDLRKSMKAGRQPIDAVGGVTGEILRWFVHRLAKIELERSGGGR